MVRDYLDVIGIGILIFISLIGFVIYLIDNLRSAPKDKYLSKKDFVKDKIKKQYTI